jgi:hypothetical protein
LRNEQRKPVVDEDLFSFKPPISREYNQSLLALRLRHFRDVAAVFEKSLDTMKESNADSGSGRKFAGSTELITEVFKIVDFATNIPNLFRRSLFTSAYALLEFHLYLLSKELESALELRVSVEDIHGQGIERSRIYLKKVAQVPFPDMSTEWQEAKQFARLRHLLLHNFGRAENKRDEKLLEWIGRNPHLDVLPWGNVVLVAASFNEHVLTTIETLFLKLGYNLESL